MIGATTRLAPDATSPGLARRLVEAAVTAAGLDALMDEALLLTTELVTNAVVHAGTEVELAVHTSDSLLRVEVVDFHPGQVPAPRDSVEDDREGGRGLFLLGALATVWGTSHGNGCKSVWFQLGDAPEQPRSEGTPTADVQQAGVLPDPGQGQSNRHAAASHGAARRTGSGSGRPLGRGVARQPGRRPLLRRLRAADLRVRSCDQ